MAITAVYAMLTEPGKWLSHKVTKPYRDTYYPHGILMLDTAQLVELPTFEEMMRAQGFANSQAEESDEDEEYDEDDEEEPRNYFTDAELSPEINSLASQVWAIRAVGEARLTAGGLAGARAALEKYCRVKF